MSNKILFLGYGNIDRQDDGVAWHILKILSDRLGVAIQDIATLGYAPSGHEGHSETPELTTELNPFSQSVDLFFVPQLTPEMAEFLAGYSEVCFIDAHTGNVPDDIQFVELESTFQASPFTHHLTPQSCLALSQSLYGQAPHGYLLSVRGFEFSFDQNLSTQTGILSNKAAEQLSNWLITFINKGK